MNKNVFFFITFYILTLLLFLSFNNWFSMWIALEMNSLTFLGLLVWNLKNKNMESGITFFIVQALSSLFLLFFLSSNSLSTNSFLSVTIMPMQMILFLKIAMAPLHNWFIPVVLNSMSYVTWLLLSWQKLPYLIFFFCMSNQMSPLMISFLFLNILLSSLSNLKQNLFKMIVTFSGISQLSWILSVTSDTKSWQLFFFCYTYLLMFFIHLSEKNKKSLFEDKSTTIILFLLSMSGLPPFFIFFSKLIVLSSVIKLMPSFIFFILMLSLIDLYIYSRVSMLLLMKKNSKKWNWNKKNLTKLLMATNMGMILLF